MLFVPDYLYLNTQLEEVTKSDFPVSLWAWAVNQYLFKALKSVHEPPSNLKEPKKKNIVALKRQQSVSQSVLPRVWR